LKYLGVRHAALAVQLSLEFASLLAPLEARLRENHLFVSISWDEYNRYVESPVFSG
jgi:hypothetical protein